jgi:hypothetical protein
MKYKVTIEKKPSDKSIHLFQSEEEASNFVSWISRFGQDLDITFNRSTDVKKGSKSLVPETN